MLRFLWLAINVAKAERVEKKYFVIESYNKIERERVAATVNVRLRGRMCA